MATFRGNGGVNSPYEFDTFQMLVDLFYELGSHNYGAYLPEENQPPEPGNVIYIDMSMVKTGDGPDDYVPRVIDLNEEFDDYLVQTMNVPTDKWTIYLNMNGGTITNICVGANQHFFKLINNTYAFTIFNGSFLNVYGSGAYTFVRNYSSGNEASVIKFVKCAISINNDGFNYIPLDGAHYLNSSLNIVASSFKSRNADSSYKGVISLRKRKDDRTLPIAENCDMKIRLLGVNIDRGPLECQFSELDTVVLSGCRLRIIAEKGDKESLTCSIYYGLVFQKGNWIILSNNVIEVDYSACVYMMENNYSVNLGPNGSNDDFRNSLVVFHEPQQMEGYTHNFNPAKNTIVLNSTEARDLDTVSNSGFTVIPVVE